MQDNILFNQSLVEKLVIAWDLDGTLFDSTHRVRFNEDGSFDLDFWVENCVHEQIFQDADLPLLALFYEFQKTGFTQIAVTARKLVQADKDFFAHKGLNFKMVLHRENSLDLDHVLKNEKLQQYFEVNNLIPFMAFDDKEDNLKIFDKFGFRTFQANYMNEKLRKGSFDLIRDLKPSMFSTP